MTASATAWISTDLWVWVAAIMTLAIFSFLYRDNPLYKFAEHLFVGVSVGYAIAVSWDRVFLPKIWTGLVLHRQWSMLPPVILGLLYISFFFPRYTWIARYPISFMMGFSAGVALPLTVVTDIFIQTRGTFYESNAAGDPLAPIISVAKFQEFAAHPGVLSALNALYGPLLLLGVVCVMLFFYFSHEQKGPLKVAGMVGMVYLMIGFGASFGYTVMARLSLLIGRIQFLLGEWLRVL